VEIKKEGRQQSITEMIEVGNFVFIKQKSNIINEKVTND